MGNQQKFMGLDGLDPNVLTPAQVAQLLAPELEALGFILAKKPDVVIKPVEPPRPAQKPVAGHPRTQVGTRLDNGVPHGIFIGTGMAGLLEVVSQPGEPDAYVDRGYNLPYDLLPGVNRPVGPETPWGLDPVPGFLRIVGYRKRFFPDGRSFWEQSTEPDEVYTAPAVKPSPTPASPSFQTTHYEPA